MYRAVECSSEPWSAQAKATEQMRTIRGQGLIHWGPEPADHHLRVVDAACCSRQVPKGTGCDVCMEKLAINVNLALPGESYVDEMSQWLAYVDGRHAWPVTVDRSRTMKKC